MDDLNKKFNIVPRKEEVTSVAVLENNCNMEVAYKDFGVARANIMTVLEEGSKAVSALGDMAYSSQDPEHFEALASMIRAVTAASDKLLTLHRKIEDLKDKNINKSEKQIPGDVHNHLHITAGSTMEISQALKMIRSQ